MNDKTKADLLENAPAIIAFHDRDHNILWANAAYREATGLSLQETEGKKCYAVWRLAKTCRNCPVTTAIETGEPAEAELTPSNQDHWPDTQGSWLTKAAPIRDQDGSIIGAVEVAYNIADRKRAEEEVRRLNEELKERVRQRTADLEATSQQLRAANQELEASNQQLRGTEQQLRAANQEFEASNQQLGASERDLRQSEKRFRSIFEQASVGMAIVAPDGTLTRVNDAFCEIVGYSRDELTHMTFQEITHPDDLEKSLHYVEQMLGGEMRRYSMEGRYLRKDGEVAWVHVSVGVVRDADGAPAYFSAAVEDITELKRSEDALRESEERLRLALSAADMGAWRWVPATNSDTRDGSFNRILGLEPVTSTQPVEDFLGRVHAEDRAAVAEAIESARRERRIYVAEFRITRPDGEVRWLRDRGMGFCDQNGEMIYMTGAVVDITELRQATDALRETNEHLENLFNYANGPNIVWDPQLKITRFNRAFESLTGRRAADVIGKSVEILFPPAMADSSMDLIKAASGGERWETVEIDVLHVDGSVRTVLWNSATLVAADGKTPTATIAQGQDMTEQRQLQEQFLQAQKLEAVGRLAGGIAHDFNNLLTGVRGFVGFARDDAEPGSQAHEDLTEVLALADRAADLTRQLLAFSRRQTLEPVVLNVNALIADQTRMLTRLLGEDIELRFLPAPDLGNVRADPGQLEQIVMNLAVNARDAMPDGGRLTIETANVELGEEYARNHAAVTPGPYVMLAISDAGCGMDEKIRARIFEPFFTTKELGKGTGLGLSTVYGIVKQHGGNIWVYSEPGEGTTFKVYLPRVSDEVEERRPPSEFVVGGGETILLVEDDEFVREVCRRHLEALGYTVVSASTAREAEEVAAEHLGQFDLLLTDVVMPDRNGRELYEALAANEAGLKVLYMSGYTDNAIVRHGVLEKGIHFLQKPFERDSLAAKVRAALDA